MFVQLLDVLISLVLIVPSSVETVDRPSVRQLHRSLQQVILYLHRFSDRKLLNSLTYLSLHRPSTRPLTNKSPVSFGKWTLIMRVIFLDPGWRGEAAAVGLVVWSSSSFLLSAESNTNKEPLCCRAAAIDRQPPSPGWALHVQYIHTQQANLSACRHTHARTHARTHTHAHTRTHTHTHARTHTQYPSFQVASFSP